MGMLIAVVAVGTFAYGSIWLWERGRISKEVVMIALGLALVVASALYWISERAA